MRRALAGLVVAGIALTTAACGGGSGGGDAGGGSLGAVRMEGASFKVGSKEFTEQLVLGQIAVQALKATGASVEDKTGIQGTTNVRTALTSGAIDMYWDYTGTGWTTLLGHTPAEAPKDSAALFKAVADEDLQKNKIKWLDPAPLNNTYAIATAQSRAQELNVHSLSDYARLANADPAKASICVASEFLGRDDGWPGVQKTYGFALPGNLVKTVDLGVIYTQVPSGQQCNFGEVTATDGRVAAQHLEVLNDDKKFFVLYNGAMTIRDDVFQKYPQLAQVFGPISAKLTDDTLRTMNQQVDVDGALPEEVAQNFLKENGFIK
ncbi:glycine betaine ABC transporter substrate-binding protein [Pseudonocardia spinosispora]|uniref:glycine betaine ABC transporter substrate-binding protein n=1 Tax=Pseudonocardia spinosispora TaxID=103441 RepID=UPI00068901E1|nr:glycine betaine ABC transporter substrate-binding protein [Pseudonocardia spinosispora]